MKRKSVFVSCATDLNPAQEESRKIVLYLLGEAGFEARTLGKSDYPYHLPLMEVCNICEQCVGGVILGFEQFRSNSGISKPGSVSEARVKAHTSFPTPWNQLEAGILLARQLPLLIFHEPQVTGGIFDPGVIDVFTHPMPTSAMDERAREIFRKWRAEVQAKYKAA